MSKTSKGCGESIFWGGQTNFTDLTDLGWWPRDMKDSSFDTEKDTIIYDDDKFQLI